MHLEADLHRVIDWAESHGVRWAFSLSNAGARYARFRSRRGDLDQLDWKAIAQADFRNPDVKERKQAELLLHGRFPFDRVSRIGAPSEATGRRATAAVRGCDHGPVVEVRPEWYY